MKPSHQGPRAASPLGTTPSRGGASALQPATQPSRSTTTTLYISNLHCPTCVACIEHTLYALGPTPPDYVSTSIASRSVTIRYNTSLSAQRFVTALEDEGFEVYDLLGYKPSESPERLSLQDQHSREWADDLDAAIKRLKQSWQLNRHASQQHTAPPSPSASASAPGYRAAASAKSSGMGKKSLHAARCAECRAEAAGHGSYDGNAQPLTKLYPSGSFDEKPADDFQVGHKDGIGRTIEVVTGKVDDAGPCQVELAITGMTCSACVSAITRAVEELAFVRSINVSLLTNSAAVAFDGKQHSQDVVQAIEDAGFEASIENLEEVRPKERQKHQQAAGDLWKASYAVGGMTCSACVGNLTNALQQHGWIDSIDVNLISNSAQVVFHGKDRVDTVMQTIEDAGFDATLDSLVSFGGAKEEADTTREVQILIDGMFCHHCPAKITDALHDTYGNELVIEKPATTSNPIIKLRYVARPPDFTIRRIMNTIKAIDEAFTASIYHPPTIEDRNRQLRERERKRILFRLALAVAAAVPAFVIGIVCMQLLKPGSPARTFVMAPVWAGNVTRANWALFILATPVYFFAADTFHRKAMKEIKALWRPGSPTPLLQRFTRFGSMNMLMSFGTTIAYVSSIAELAIAATQKPIRAGKDGAGGDDGDSTYFDSVIFLTMFLLTGRFIEAYSKAKTGDAVTSLGKLRPTEAILVEKEHAAGRKLSVDLLEVGDVVMVPNGASPPFDGVIADGASKFDESSLTGESRLVSKGVGAEVFSGTVNRAGPVLIRLTSVSGTSMLDQIIKIVREGQTKRAPIERAADVITSHFVPFVVAVGLVTWLMWLMLGLSEALPRSWLEGQVGGWPLWSLRFAIAVFVVACPCGIGLAAPTALFVGGGMAANNGILVKGGGDAFQEASTLDCIVFDKTGTLTVGGEPKVTDYERLFDGVEKEVLGFTKKLEENSGHPIAKAIASFCAQRTAENPAPSDVQEIAGKGMFGRFKRTRGSKEEVDVEVIVGNERLMADYGVQVGASPSTRLQQWKRQGRSVVLVAVRAASLPANTAAAAWMLSSLFAVSDALRPEAKSTVAALQNRGIDVWMLSGDNLTTARAVGEMVGISGSNVIAGVLPDQKAEKIQWLQKTLPVPKSRSRRTRPRATVAMVGDGINDSPALTMADVGIAIGSGSDVAISSADFILISSDLDTLLTLIDLSRKVFRRVWFNFGWALVYNLIAMPIAAGVFYPIVSQGKHVRLDPVFASLAMALSSVSVICSSLMLRSGIPGIGFRAKKAAA